MKGTHLNLALLVGLGGCVAGQSESIDDTFSLDDIKAEQGGFSDSGHKAVGLLDLGGGFCSATLVAPDVVVTAAHCVAGQQPVAFYTGAGRPTTSPSIDFEAAGMTGTPVADSAYFPGYGAGQCPNPT